MPESVFVDRQQQLLLKSPKLDFFLYMKTDLIQTFVLTIQIYQTLRLSWTNNAGL